MTRPGPYVAGVGTALPGPPVDNATLAKHLHLNEEWIDAFIGTRTRHLAVDLATGTTSCSLADLSVLAAERACAAAGVPPAELGFLVLGTATPDALMPATVNLVADRLGVNRLPTYQLQSGCAGAIQAFDVASRMLGPDGAAAGLVLGGDVCAKHLDLDRDFARLPAAELVNHVLFGDGAGAAVVTREPAGRAVALRAVLNQLVGLGRPPGQVVEWFGPGDRPGRRPAASEDYKAIEESVPVLTAEILWELAADAGWELDEIDFLLPPQLSGVMTSRIVAGLGLPGAREVSCVRDTGNIGNGLPFVQLEQLLDLIGPGQRALCAAVESSKWIKAGLALEAA